MGKINIEDLRIVKLYGVYEVVKDIRGGIENIEIVKTVPYFVLVKKHGNQYKVVPTSKLVITQPIKEFSEKQYDLVINKVRKNNRYRKPVSLCPSLRGQTLTIEQTKEFAEKIQTINSNLSEKVTQQLLTNVCQLFANDLKHSTDDSFVL